MPTPASPFTQRLLIIGWDAADWKVIDPLIKKGEMPNLARLIAGGVYGDISTLQPILSPMLWNSIATGVRADQHGVLGFTEVCPTTGNVRPVSSVSRKVRALWNMVNLRGGRSHVVNWFCSHPADPIDGIFVSDSSSRHLPLRVAENKGALPDTFHIAADLQKKKRGLSPEAMESLRVLPEEIDPAILQLFVPRAAEIDQKKDRKLVALAKVLAESFTVHNYAVAALEAGEWDLAAFYYPSIDHFSHAFMNFHPPKMEEVSEEMFALYSDVVNGGYRLHDLFLGRLLQLVGDDVSVILLSDHGFHSDHLRPKVIPQTPTGPEVQHRELGIFAMRGPGIKAGQRIYGVSLLDITPTALTLLGLPVGQDMPGRVLAEAFEAPPQVNCIPTWEAEPGDDGRYRGEYVLPQDASDALLEQFIGLGYIDPQDNDRTRAAEATRREQHWNLARTYMHAGRFDRAAPILQEIHAEAPERIDIAIALVEALWRIGLREEAEALLTVLAEADHVGPRMRFLLGVAALEAGRTREAISHLLEAEALGSGGPLFYVRLGHAFLRLRRIDDADRAFTRAIALNPHEPAAYLGRAGCALRMKKPEEAALNALRAVGMRRDLPLAHLVLGRALVALGRGTEAIAALELALRLNPDLLRARRILYRLYALRPETVVQAAQQKLEINRTRERRRTARDARTGSWNELRAAVSENVRLLRERLQRQAEAATPCDIVVVSGLPRSGTSLMMQMLQAGGVPILTDGERTADDDNPEGYLEWEAVKRLRAHPEQIREADGKAVKIISMLLPALPHGHHYRILFMDRDPAEIAASQAKMLQRRGGASNATDSAADPLCNPDLLKLHRNQAIAALRKRKDVRLLVVPYAGMVADPERWAARVAKLLGEGRIPHPDRMTSAVRPDLYRNRTEKPAAEAAEAEPA